LAILHNMWPFSIHSLWSFCILFPVLVCLAKEKSGNPGGEPFFLVTDLAKAFLLFIHMCSNKSSSGKTNWRSQFRIPRCRQVFLCGKRINSNATMASIFFVWKAYHFEYHDGVKFFCGKRIISDVLNWIVWLPAKKGIWPKFILKILLLTSYFYS
jgi:hypothetical protein